jgi:ubiquinol-cytochrome c reductase iron-sulfur subunit
MTDLNVQGMDHRDGEAVSSRRDFLSLIALTTATAGAGAIAWPLVSSMNPSGDVLAMSQTEVDLAPIQPGQGVIVVWQGRPVFIRHRTEAEIELAREVVLADLRDPQSDAERVKPGHETWLVVSGVCTHLGCVPGGSSSNQPRGDFGGWFCACHGSQYDTAGRIRKGPAPANLPGVPYVFATDTRIVIG